MRRVVLVGLIEPGLGFLARLPTLRPLARELTHGGVSSQVVASELLPAERAVLWALTKAAGLGKYRSAGLRAREVARAARGLALTQSTGLVFVYLNDCDQAGHAHGWMSPQYRAAAVEVDAAVGVLAELSEHSLLIVMSDHGGGAGLETCCGPGPAVRPDWTAPGTDRSSGSVLLPVRSRRCRERHGRNDCARPSSARPRPLASGGAHRGVARPAPGTSRG